MDVAPTGFGLRNQFLYDFDAVGIDDVPDVLTRFRTGETESVPSTGKHIAVVTDADCGNSFQHFLLNLAFHVVEVFAGSDDPVKGCKAFDKGYLAMVLARRLRLGAQLGTKAFAFCFSNVDDFRDDIALRGVELL